VESDLASAGVPSDQITRIGGTDAATVAASIATAMDKRSATDKAANLPAFDAVVIAKAGTPEAGAASTLAVSRRLPVLYTDSGALPSATSAALSALGVTKALVVEGTDVISDSVLQQLTGAGVTPTRLGGSDAVAVSAAVVKEAIARGLPSNQVFVADASNPLQGALLGSSTGRVGGLILLTHGGSAADAQSMLSSLGIDAQVARIVTPTSGSW
jgi:putative cell wall-binding protein